LGGICRTNWRDGNAYRILAGKSEGKKLLGRQSASKKIVLKLTLEKQCVRMWIGFRYHRIGKSGGLM
jgi:hypothetical protein